MAKAIWQGVVIAESNNTKEIEGNLYFPPQSLKQEYFQSSKTTSVCSWKGTAHYYDIKVGDEINHDAAWTYRQPKDAARHIAEYVAFWRGVEVKK
ncbi:MAG TPA: DUF427 domain-containing protein [Candidatus Obscuribacterales bacterium]